MYRIHKLLLFKIYSFLIMASEAGIWIASFFNKKILKLRKGRVATFELFESFTHSHPQKIRIWFHFASLGEFEQGRPVIESLNKKKVECEIFISFFSPSGYEVRKNYSPATCIFYLPSDSSVHANTLINKIQPHAFVLTKYDFWWNLLNELNRKAIPVYLISGVFRKNQYFFNNLFKPFLNELRSFKHIFVQDNQSADTLRHFNVQGVSVTGDTRIDRVLDIATNAVIDSTIHEWSKDLPVAVYGSVWMNDIKVLIPWIRKYKTLKHIIVPHDVTEQNVRHIKNKISCTVSVLSKGIDKDTNILIVDKVGILNQLYKIADWAYIGGGFGKGIHNILEASVYGIPVIYGPNYKKFMEAKSMIQEGIGFTVKNTEEFGNIVSQFKQPGFKSSVKSKSEIYFRKSKGATVKVTREILEDIKSMHTFTR